MATITVAIDFYEDIGNKIHNLSSDTLQIALSNTAPTSEVSNPLAAGNGVLANVTQITYTNYADDLTVDRVLENVTWSLVAGVATLVADDFQISASGGALADWRYLYVFNQTATNDEIICAYDRGSVVSLADTDVINVDLGNNDGTTGTILQMGAGTLS